MRKLILLCTSLCAMALVMSASPARAQVQVWVSSFGLDTNACTQASPCLTFQGAINKYANVGLINCLNSGNYGPVTIIASVTIDCGAGNLGVIASYSNAITINTSTPATIILRHLILDSLGQSPFGIYANIFHSGALIVEDCRIEGFPQGYGILFAPTAGRGLLQVSNSQIFGGLVGIGVVPQNGQIVSLTLDRVEMIGTSNAGLYLRGSGVVAGVMRHSVAASNGLFGVNANASQVYFTIEESSIVANLNTGIITQSAGSVVNVAASTIVGNGKGVDAPAGSLISFGDNHINANGSDGTFTGTKALK